MKVFRCESNWCSCPDCGTPNGDEDAIMAIRESRALLNDLQARLCVSGEADVCLEVDDVVCIVRKARDDINNVLALLVGI